MDQTKFEKRAIHFVAPKMSNSYFIAVLLNSYAMIVNNEHNLPQKRLEQYM